MIANSFPFTGVLTLGYAQQSSPTDTNDNSFIFRASPNIVLAVLPNLPVESDLESLINQGATAIVLAHPSV